LLPPNWVIEQASRVAVGLLALYSMRLSARLGMTAAVNWVLVVTDLVVTAGRSRRFHRRIRRTGIHSA
jgi:hypothetical protein